MITISESWLSGVLESAITVFILFLTVPTITFQIYVPEDLKKYSKIISRNMVVTMYVKLVAIIFLIILTIPITNNFDSQVISFIHLITVIILIILYVYQVTIEIIKVISQETTFRDVVFNEYCRKTILAINNGNGISISNLREFKYLFRHTENGMAKERLLDGIEILINDLFENPNFTYQGTELSFLFNEVLSDSILENIDGASQAHMNKVLSIYKSFILRFDSNEKSDLGDLLSILEGTYRISSKAIEHNYLSVITNGIDVLYNIENSQLHIFKIGEKNFEYKNYNLSLESLNKLAFQFRQYKRKEYYYCYLGLISYFINFNESLKNIALSILDKHKSMFPSVKYNLINDYFKFNGNYTVLEPMRLSNDEMTQHITIDMTE